MKLSRSLLAGALCAGFSFSGAAHAGQWIYGADVAKAKIGQVIQTECKLSADYDRSEFHCAVIGGNPLRGTFYTLHFPLQAIADVQQKRVASFRAEDDYPFGDDPPTFSVIGTVAGRLEVPDATGGVLTLKAVRLCTGFLRCTP